jgi:hypothetical protein
LLIFACSGNLGTAQRDDELPDARASTNTSGCGLDIGQGMDKGLTHSLAALLFKANCDHVTLG